jgi:hypothetical protein
MERVRQRDREGAAFMNDNSSGNLYIHSFLGSESTNSTLHHTVENRGLKLDAKQTP